MCTHNSNTHLCSNNLESEFCTPLNKLIMDFVSVLKNIIIIIIILILLFKYKDKKVYVALRHHSVESVEDIKD